jgi:sulfonate transport system permease protein
MSAQTENLPVAPSPSRPPTEAERRAAAVQRAPRTRNRQPAYTALRWCSPLILIGIWQVLSATGVLDPKTLASPIDIGRTTIDLIQTGQLSEALTVSLKRAAIGFAWGAAVALLFGAFVGLSKLGDALVDPIFQMIRTIPLFGLVPLFILWFGIGEGPKVTLVALGVVVPLYLNLVAALRGIDPELGEVATTLRLSRWERWRHLIIPSVLPGTLVGLRQSLGIAWLALIVAEQVNAQAGIGFMINNARDFLQTDIIVVGLLTYAVLGLLTDSLVRLLERRALRWRDEGVTA